MEEAVAIIPTYNRARYLADCIGSVLDQTRAPAEVLVVDDGSTDETPQTVAAFGDRVTYIRKANSGKAASLNLALQKSHAPLVWIVDDDDIVCHDALERLAGLLERSPAAGFAYGRHTRFVVDEDTGGSHDIGTGYWCRCSPERFLTATLEDFFAHQPGMVVRRGLYEKVGFFDESLVRSQDYEMAIRLARAGDCVSTDEIVFHQRQHDGMRGDRSERLSADDVTRRWIKYDQGIFRRLYREMALQEFLPRGEQLVGGRARRRALIQRGVVMARRKLWKTAARDFERAARLDCGPFSAEEKRMLRRAFSSKYGCDEVLSNRKVAANLAGIDAANAGSLRKNLARGLIWRIREAGRAGRAAKAAMLFAFALRLCAGRHGAIVPSGAAGSTALREVKLLPSSASSMQKGRSEE